MFKRGQQSSFGMSFGMIFSIFLIIIFVATAIIVITVFLDFSSSANVGQFMDDFQSEVTKAWRSSGTSKSFDLDLSSDITKVCFANLSAPINAHYDVFREIRYYELDGYNMFLFPASEAEGFGRKEIEHLDINEITRSSNPRCFDNPGKVTISKGPRDRLVTVS
jgi:hypothetical protein